METIKSDVGMTWEIKRLVDVCDFQGGTQPPKSEWSTMEKDGFVRMIQIRDFTQGKDRFIEYVKDSQRLKKCIATDIMIGRYGASIGKILTGLEGAYNVALVKTIPSKILDKNYFYHYLNTPYFQNFIQNAGSRAAQAGFNKEELKDLQIPLPPLPIQKRIAEILDAADALKRKDQELLKKYDELAQAIFIDMFGDPVKNEKGWEVKKLGDLSDIGSSVRVFVDELVDDGIPFLRGQEIGAMSNGENIVPSLFITKKHYDKLNGQGGVPKIGDLLMPSICPDGRIFQVVNNEPFYFKDGRVLWIKTNERYFDSTFLKFLLKEKFLRNYSNIASGSTFAELKIFALKAIELPVPPIALQIKFAKMINNGVVQINSSRFGSKLSSSLFQTLIQKAFKGELV